MPGKWCSHSGPIATTGLLNILCQKIYSWKNLRFSFSPLCSESFNLARKRSVLSFWEVISKLCQSHAWWECHHVTRGLGHTRYLTMLFTVGALSHMASAWLAELLEAEVSRVGSQPWSPDRDSRCQGLGELPWLAVLSEAHHPSLWGSDLPWLTGRRQSEIVFETSLDSGLPASSRGWF